MIVAVLGGGKIGEAIARGLARSDRVSKVYVTRRSGRPLHPPLKKLIVTKDNRKAAKEAEVLFLSVKSTDARHLLSEIAEVAQYKLVISVMAAIKIARLEDALPQARVVRAMPNVAASVGQAMTAYAVGAEVLPEDRELLQHFLGTFGESLEVPEHLMDAITALSGSGPAYIAILIDAMVSGALKVGVPREVAFQLVTKTLTGTADLLREKGIHPAELRDLVTTPAGTTIAGIYELEKGAFRTSIMNAIEAATQASEKVAERFEKDEEGRARRP